jgi:hypothetical protein
MDPQPGIGDKCPPSLFLLLTVNKPRFVRIPRRRLAEDHLLRSTPVAPERGTFPSEEPRPERGTLQTVSVPMTSIINWCKTADELQEVLGGRENALQMLGAITDPNISSSQLSKTVHSCTVKEALQAIESLLPDGHTDRSKFVSILEFGCSKCLSRIQGDSDMLEKQIQELLRLRLKSDTGKWATYQLARHNWSATERNRLRGQLNKYVRVEDYKALEAKHQALEAEHETLKAEQETLKAEQETLKAKHQALEAEHETLYPI